MLGITNCISVGMNSKDGPKVGFGTLGTRQTTSHASTTFLAKMATSGPSFHIQIEDKIQNLNISDPSLEPPIAAAGSSSETTTPTSELPTDVFSHLSSLLARFGLKRTLLELMLCNHTAFECGLAHLYRELEMLPRNAALFANSSRDVLGCGKFRHVRTLKVVDFDYGREPRLLEFVSRAIRNATSLLLSCRRAEFSLSLESLLVGAPNLSYLAIDSSPDAKLFDRLPVPPKLKKLRVKPPASAPGPRNMLRLFEGVADQLEEWEMVWPAHLEPIKKMQEEFPKLLAKLKYLRTATHRILEATQLPLRELQLDAEEQNAIEWELLKEQGTIEKLVIWGLSTWQLPTVLASLPAQLNSLVLLRPYFTLPTRKFDSVRMALNNLGQSKFQIRHARDGSIESDDEVLEGMDQADPEAELVFWTSLRAEISWLVDDEASMRRAWYDAIV